MIKLLKLVYTTHSPFVSSFIGTQTRAETLGLRVWAESWGQKRPELLSLCLSEPGWLHYLQQINLKALVYLCQREQLPWTVSGMMNMQACRHPSRRVSVWNWSSGLCCFWTSSGRSILTLMDRSGTHRQEELPINQIKELFRLPLKDIALWHLLDVLYCDDVMLDSFLLGNLYPRDSRTSRWKMVFNEVFLNSKAAELFEPIRTAGCWSYMLL